MIAKDSRSGPADPEAVAHFREAVANRAQWEDFPGFRAEVSGEIEGDVAIGSYTGTADVYRWHRRTSTGAQPAIL